MPIPAFMPSSATETIWFSHCEVSPWVIASHEFNREPQPLRLVGVRETNRGLFRALDAIEDQGERGQHFHEYVSVKFALHYWSQYDGKAQKHLRNSYLRFLMGWGVNSSSVEGAVLKAWVQSRFGIRPTFHRRKLPAGGADEDITFARDRMRGGAYTNAIESQLDLLYEFCQYELSRRYPGERWMKLYRGTYDPEEHPVLEQKSPRRLCVRLNNLCSFTSERERAWEFGSTVWEAQVPLVKIIFFSGLLPDNLLQGEAEHLVVGGEYWVRDLLY